MSIERNTVSPPTPEVDRWEIKHNDAVGVEATITLAQSDGDFYPYVDLNIEGFGLDVCACTAQAAGNRLAPDEAREIAEALYEAADEAEEVNRRTNFIDFDSER